MDDSFLIPYCKCGVKKNEKETLFFVRQNEGIVAALSSIVTRPNLIPFHHFLEGRQLLLPLAGLLHVCMISKMPPNSLSLLLFLRRQQQLKA